MAGFTHSEQILAAIQTGLQFVLIVTFDPKISVGIALVPYTGPIPAHETEFEHLVQNATHICKIGEVICVDADEAPFGCGVTRVIRCGDLGRRTELASYE